MAWSASHVSNLDNSMVAAQDVALGTFLGNIVSNGTIASGSVLPVSASLCLVNTGLTTIKGFSVFHSGSPTTGIALVSACIVGAYLNIKSWTFGSASSTDLIAATTLDTVQWIAVGAD